MYKPLADSTLHSMTKKEIIELLRIAEHNAEVCQEWVAQQAENLKDWVPVVHGRWDESKEHFYLNNGCKEWTNFYCSECDAPNNSPTDYCPNCGAKMDGAE